jgi:glycyl-tRNA synthetase alpha subunit
MESVIGRVVCLTGINIHEHDIRFVEDNWESPVNFYLLLGVLSFYASTCYLAK